jgi:hypothetical protein
MYFVTVIILWWLIHIFSGGEFTEEMGCLVGLFIEIIYTIIYIILFVWPVDYNWIDIFHNGINLNIKW